MTIINVPDRLADHTTLFKHNMYSYLPCVIIRITIALLFMSSIISNRVMTGISVLIVLMFLWKYIKIGSSVWKNYLRTVLIYTLIIICLNLPVIRDNQYCKVVVTMLIIIDALLGQQSRFTAQLLIK